MVRPDGAVEARRQLALSPDRPMPGLGRDRTGRRWPEQCWRRPVPRLDEVGQVTGVGVTNQRGTTIVWDAGTGEPIGPALSWQDLRTAGTCLELQAEGLRLAPNESATKLAWLLDTYDPARSRDLRFGTLDTWVTWLLTDGRAHITDPSNAAVTRPPPDRGGAGREVGPGLGPGAPGQVPGARKRACPRWWPRQATSPRPAP